MAKHFESSKKGKSQEGLKNRDNRDVLNISSSSIHLDESAEEGRYKYTQKI